MNKLLRRISASGFMFSIPKVGEIAYKIKLYRNFNEALELAAYNNYNFLIPISRVISLLM